jgi:hypothetical protein
MSTKVCPQCGISRPLAQFRIDESAPDQRAPRCIFCLPAEKPKDEPVVKVRQARKPRKGVGERGSVAKHPAVVADHWVPPVPSVPLSPAEIAATNQERLEAAVASGKRQCIEMAMHGFNLWEQADPSADPSEEGLKLYHLKRLSATGIPADWKPLTQYLRESRVESGKTPWIETDISHLKAEDKR